MKGRDKPFINDFAFYKARFTQKQRDLKTKLASFSALVDRFEA